MKRYMVLTGVVAIVAVLAVSSSTAMAADFGLHFGGRGYHLDVGRTHAPVHYGGLRVAHWGGHYDWHDTSHYDYHPGEFVRHGNHFHYVPGHYDFHETGHWDHHGW